MDWKDTLLPGASRVPVPVGTPGSVPDYYGTPVGRMDFVMGPNGPVISGSSEQQGGAMTPSPGFEPVDPGVYGGQVFSGRPSGAAGSQALQGYQGSSAELLALLKALQALVPGGQAGTSPSGLLLPG